MCFETNYLEYSLYKNNSLLSIKIVFKTNFHFYLYKQFLVCFLMEKTCLKDDDQL
jgi:hypothetical protein